MIDSFSMRSKQRNPHDRGLERLAFAAIALLQISLTFGMIALVFRHVEHSPILAMLGLAAGTPILAIFAYGLANRHVLKRLRTLRNGLSAEQDARNAAEAAAREKSRLLATMTHEIRTPLNGVIGMIGLLLESELDPDQRNYADMANGSGRILLSIIDEILDGAKSEALRTNDVAPIDVVALVENVTELLAPRAHAKNIDVVSRVASDVPATIIGDDMRLRQVLFNLAGNAIKFTERGGVAIEVLMSAEKQIVLRVRDSGIGMTADELNKVFEPFAQANDSTQRRFGGTGLGLAISLKLVETMGGKLAATSAPGIGTTLDVALPLQISKNSTPPSSQHLVGRQYQLVLSNNFLNDHLVAQLNALGAIVETTSPDDFSAAKTLFQNADQHLICDASTIRRILRLAKQAQKKGKALPQIWVVLTPDERRILRSQLSAPLTGYLMRPVRCSTLIDQLTARDSARISSSSQQLRQMAKRGRAALPQDAAIGLHVLVTDDTPVNAVIASAILKRSGHTVTVARSGEETLELLENGSSFDILLLDMEMPGLSGPETAERIRLLEKRQKRPAQLPILALTANTRPESIETCIKAGMDGYLPKPFDAADLENEMHRLTGKYAA